MSLKLAKGATLDEVPFESVKVHFADSDGEETLPPAVFRHSSEGDSEGPVTLVDVTNGVAPLRWSAEGDTLVLSGTVRLDDAGSVHVS